MLVDAIIIVLIISAVVRGRETGFVQQLFSTAGFFGGLILGAAMQPHTVTLVEGQMARSLVTLMTTLGVAFLGLAIGESLGILAKRRMQMGKVNKLDNVFGGVLGVVSILVAVWLSATVIQALPFPGIQKAMQESKITSQLTQRLPFAPNVIASIGHLVDPNGFPQVFTDGEPDAPDKINLPASSTLLAAVNKDRESVVKVVGQGCGGLVDGSGFVVGDDTVVTNAHVVAGIQRQYVTDSKGTHSAAVIWFDPGLDLAVLRVSNLASSPLPLSNKTVANKTPAAILGFPGGGAFSANPAVVLDQFTARGRDIYGRGNTNRSIYEIASDVEPGNSGGPLVSADGTVVGVVFARSTSYENVGYVLTMGPVISAVNRAVANNSVVTTGSCAE